MLGFISIFTAFGLASQFVHSLLMISIFLGIFLLAGCCVGITNTIAVDLFPTHFRAMAMSISLMFGRFGAVTGSHVIGPLLYNYCEYTLYTLTGVNIGEYVNIYNITTY